jgi:hypothetical protein
MEEPVAPVMEEPVVPITTSEKCSFRSCKVNGALLITCSAQGCSKKVHLMCFQGLLLKRYTELQALPVGKVACTKRCHGKIVKETAGGGEDADGGNRKGNWDCDGLDGVKDPHTSVKILLDWWMTEGNYNKFCGKHNNGTKKIQFANNLAEKMSRETNSQRNAKNVLNKIQHIEKTFKDAHLFASSETGAGLKEDDEGTFEDSVKKKCPYYFDLLDIMADRASSKPKATSYDDSEESEVFDIQGMSELSDGEEVVEEVGDKSVATKRTARTSSNTTSSRKAKKKRIPGIIDDAVEVFTEASKNSKEKMDEMVRHNQFIEKLEERKMVLEEEKKNLEERKVVLEEEKRDLEERKVVIEEKKMHQASWQNKNDKLQYQMQLLDQYNNLKQNHNWSDERIVAFNPDMKLIVDSEQT